MASTASAAVHEYKVGEISIVAIADGKRTAALRDDFVGNASRGQVNAALASAALPKDQLTTIFTPIVVKTAGRIVLIDTGNGPDAVVSSEGSCGLLQNHLAEAGLMPEDIDLVVISHFHGDHVNGLRSGDRERVFPNAEITVPEVEWRFWMDDGEMARASAGRMADLFRNNRRIFDPLRNEVSRYAWDREIVPGLTAVGTPGHSIGHTSFIVSSGNQSVFVQSDITNHPALFVRNPDWHASFDQDPQMAVATRRRVYDMLANEGMAIQAFHHPFPGHGFIEKDGKGGYRVVPAG